MDVLIWKKSIYDNNFKCTRCGKKLFDVKKNEPTCNLNIDSETVNDVEHDLFCKCGYYVGKQKVSDHVEWMEGEDYLKGNLDEWFDNKKKEIEADAISKADNRAKKKLQKEIQTLINKLTLAENAMISYKTECERKLSMKDKQIQELTKEITALEAQMRKMEKQMLKGADNGQ